MARQGDEPMDQQVQSGTDAANSVQSTDAVIQFQNVGLRYGSGPEVLNDIGFSAYAGQFYFLTGASGAGKSSLLKLIYLALRPSRGTIRLFGQDLSSLGRRDLPPLRQRIGVVFQDFKLLDHLSVFDNVALPLRIAGAPEAEIRANVTELLRWVGLGDRLDAPPSTLSGGQQQRVAIARAVVNRPRLLVADEPTGNVDDAMAVRLMYLFERLHELGTTVIVATHNTGLIERFPHPCLRLDGGRLGTIDG